MSRHTRRQFIHGGVTTAVYGATLLNSSRLFASPFGLPLGLQLYSVRDLLPKDFDATLREVAAIGYREVEAAGFFGHSATDVKQSMAAAGLSCVSAHYPWAQLDGHLDSIIDFHKVLGADYIVCSSPGHKNPPAAGAPASHSLTRDDWHWNAEQFNQAGAKVKAAGLKFGYHNHVAEFAAVPSAQGSAQAKVVPYDDLLRLTDPALVTFEMDCGWVTVGGGDPVAYLRQYPDRISMLHVKDFKPATASTPAGHPEAAELGRGTTDFHAIFKAVKPDQIKHYFVEQEAFDIPPFEALKIDADYMLKLTA